MRACKHFPLGAAWLLGVIAVLAGCGLFGSAGTGDSGEPERPVLAPPPEPPANIDAGGPKCPVDGTDLSNREFVPYVHEGRTIRFCNRRCCEEFKNDPNKYAVRPPASSTY